MTSCARHGSAQAQWRWLCGLWIGSCCVLSGLAVAQPGPDGSLIERLRHGGLVLVMRHASSPREPPTTANANADNRKLERQLDESGRRDATEMGAALRRLRIPIGAVYTSPTYRALETVRLAGLDHATALAELGNGGQSMQSVTDAQVAWLRARTSEVPKLGNTVIVTHQPNLSRAFPDWGPTVRDGEMVILRPDGHGATEVVGRVPITEWRALR